jgi:RimJ/RimL family protein N-acetyltransferase
MALINADPEVTRYLGPAARSGSAFDFYAYVTGHWERHGFGYWAVESLQDGELLGFTGVGYPTFLPELADQPEIGWRLARAAWGRGLATEAGVAARDHAFAVLGLPALISIIHPDNVPSRRVATKLGMTIGRRIEHPALGQLEVWRRLAVRFPADVGDHHPQDVG